MQQFARRDWLKMMAAAGLMSSLSSAGCATSKSTYQHTNVRVPIASDNPAILFHEAMCIYCGACKRVCHRVMSVEGFYDLAKTGDVPICVHCGQCSTVCEGEAIVMRPEWQAVKAAKAAGKIIVVSLSPAVRVAVAEAFGKPAGAFCEGEVIAAMRALGADYVLDTSVGADMTIIEEAEELVRRMKTGEAPLPQLTSCCPAWVEFCELYFPELLPHLSTTKSPIAMQGVAIKTFFARQKGLDPAKIYNVALTPCPAKKFEIRRPEFEIDGCRGMDAVVTVRELADWIAAENLDYAGLSPSTYDRLLGDASGAGIIFGNTGGVMEAILRTAYFVYNGVNPPEVFFSFEPVRGLNGTDSNRPGDLKRATVALSPSKTIEVLVVQGLANARAILEQLRAGTVKADLIEVMACEGGCIGGAGLPRAKHVPYLTRAMRQARIDALYARDASRRVRLAHENADLKAFYEQYVKGQPETFRRSLLHTSYHSRAKLLG